MIATNIVFSAKETRGFVKRVAVSLALTLAAVLGFVVILLIAVAAPSLWEHLGLSEAIKTALGLIQWAVLWLVIVLGLPPTDAQPRTPASLRSHSGPPAKSRCRELRHA